MISVVIIFSVRLVILPLEPWKFMFTWEEFKRAKSEPKSIYRAELTTFMGLSEHGGGSL